MKIAIVDDEIFWRERIRKILRKQYSDEDILDFKSMYEYKKSYEKFDFLLLDIELGDEQGTSYVKEENDKQQFIIYVSSHSEKVWDVFHRKISGFVPKDALEERLISKINEIEEEQKLSKQIKFIAEGGMIIVNEQDIIYLHCSNDVVSVITNHKQQSIYLTARSLLETESMLPLHFYRVNRNYIVNLHNVKRILPTELSIIMEKDVKIKVSERKWVSFKTQYQKARHEYA